MGNASTETRRIQECRPNPFPSVEVVHSSQSPLSPTLSTLSAFAALNLSQSTPLPPTPAPPTAPPSNASTACFKAPHRRLMSASNRSAS